MNHPCDGDIEHGNILDHDETWKGGWEGFSSGDVEHELQELWKGVWTKDDARRTIFKFESGALMGPSDDFPARSSLYGVEWARLYACPTLGYAGPNANMTARMKANSDGNYSVRQALSWFVLKTVEVDVDISAYRELVADNVETNSRFNGGEVCGTKNAIDILHTTQCSGVSTLGLDGEMYYGQLEEILELTYIGNHGVAYILDHTVGDAESPEKVHYEDLIKTWWKMHSKGRDWGALRTQKTCRRSYWDMIEHAKILVRAGVIPTPYKTDQDILDEVVPSTKRQKHVGERGEVTGCASTSRRLRVLRHFQDVISREEMDRDIVAKEDQEAKLFMDATPREGREKRAYLAAIEG
ncbi:hypothetical protein Tco_0058915 [Tanacetum coccineum]